MSSTDIEKVQKLFTDTLNDKKLTIAVEAMPVDELPVIITQNEFMRRMQDMAATGGQNMFYGSMPVMYNVSVNANHEVTQKILNTSDEAEQKTLIKHAYNLALLSQGLLTGAELTTFIQQAAARL
jgi:molecular chaperone HtpG